MNHSSSPFQTLQGIIMGLSSFPFIHYLNHIHCSYYYINVLLRILALVVFGSWLLRQEL